MSRSPRRFRPVYLLGLGLLAPLLTAGGGVGSALCVGDECVDGVKDMTLTFTLDQVEFRRHAFKKGAKLQLNGRVPGCYDSPCSRPSHYVRSMRTGQLLAASFGGIPSWVRTADGIDRAPLRPVVYQEAESGLCTPYDAGCEDGTVYEQATLDISLSNDDSDDFGRLVSRTAGWAPGGYHVNVGSLLLGTYSCDGPEQGVTYIIRDACDADSDCPEPTVMSSCDTPDRTSDRFGIDLGVPRYYTGNYEAFCKVLSATSDASGSTWRVALDCVNTLELRDEED